MKNSLMQEGFLSDIFNLFISNRESNKKRKTDDVYLKGSVSRYTKNLVMTFPVLCDNTLSIDTAQMISRANERNAATMMQMLLSSASLKGQSGSEVLSRFHKNIDDNMALDDYIDAVDGYVSTYTKESAIDRAHQREALTEMTKTLPQLMKTFPAESFNERSVNDYLVRNSGYNNNLVVYEAQKPDPQPKTASELDQDKYNLDKDKFNHQKEEDRYRRSKDNREFESKNFPKLVDSDVKKANELQPTLMVINVNDVDKDGNIVNTFNFLAGVKSRLVSCDSMDISERVSAKNKTRLNMKNLIRATSGEINFIKDFLLCINQAKVNAKNAVKKGEAARIWDILEKRGIKNNMNKIKNSGNDASAITTLVVNMETANYIKSAYKVDLQKPSEAAKLMEDYNLMGLVLADEANEVAHFIYDGNRDYESVSYFALQKDVSDKSYKKTINLINQAGR